MTILGRDVSENTESLIQEITGHFRHSVKYCELSTLKDYSSDFGATSVMVQDGFHTIYLNPQISLEQFETTILHELRHIQQQYSGFPLLCNKTGNAVFASDVQFFKKLGAKTQSSLFDIDVIFWLKSLGYSSSIFSEFDSHEDLSKRLGSMTHQSLRDNYNFAEASLTLYFIQYRASETEKFKIIDAFRDFQDVIKASNDIATLIDQSKCSSPLYVTQVLCAIVDYFSMWSVYFVLYNGKKIRTHNEYQTFLESHM